MVVPVMRNTEALPALTFAIIVLLIATTLWGTGVIARQTVIAAARLILVLSVLSFFFPLTAKGVPEKLNSLDSWLSTVTTPSATKAEPAQYVAPVMIAKPTAERNLYRFGEDGCVSYHMRVGKASFYPKGGTVTTTDSEGESWDDTPGELNTHEGSTDKDGEYRTCRKDPKAWGIEVWN